MILKWTQKWKLKRDKNWKITEKENDDENVNKTENKMWTVMNIIGKISNNCTPWSAIKSLRAQNLFLFCFYVYFTYTIIIAQ